MAELKVAVRIGADADELIQGVRKAQQAVSTAAAQMSGGFASAGAQIQQNMVGALSEVSDQAQSAAQGGIADLSQAAQDAFAQATPAAVQLASEEQRLNALFRAGAIDADALAQALERVRSAGSGQPPAGGGLVGGLASQFGQFAVGLVGAVASIATVRAAIAKMDEFEQLDIQLQAVTGSAEAGEQAFAWVKDFAAKTPFDVQQVAQAFVMLKNNGLDPMDGTLASISDTAAKYTQGSDGMIRVIGQLTQAYGKGKIQAEDMNILAEQGVPVWAALAGAMGKSEEEVRQLSTTGRLGKDAVKALIEELGRMSDGQAAAKMQSLTGLWSNFVDSISNAVDTLRRAGGLDPLKAALSGVNEALDALKTSGALDAFMGKLGETLGVAGGVFTQLMGLASDVLGAIGEAWDGLTSAVGGATGQQIGFMDILKGALSALELIVITVRGAFEISWASIRAVGVDVVSVLVGAMQSLQEGLLRLASDADTILTRAGIYFNTFGEVASRALALDFDGARAAYAAGMGRIEAEVRSSTARLANIDAEAARRAKENAAARITAAGEVASAAERTGQRLQAALMRGVDGAASGGAAGGSAPAGPRRKVGLLSGDADGGGQANSRMAEFEANLAAKKLAHEAEQNANGTFFAFTEAQEQAHWAALRGQNNLSKAERLGVEAKFQAATTALRQTELKAELEAIKEAADNRRSSMAERLAKENELVALLARVRGTESAEYRAAVKSRQQLEDEAAKEATTNAVELIRLRQSLDQEALKTRLDVLNAEVAAGKVGKAELLAAERTFAVQKLELLKQSLQDQLAEMQKYPELFGRDITRTQGQIGEVDQQIEGEKKKPQKKLKGSEKAQADEQQLSGLLGDGAAADGAVAMFRQVEAGFGEAINGMILKGQGLRASMTQLWTGLSKTFIQEMVTKPLASWVAGQARLLAIKLATAIRERFIDKTSAKESAVTMASSAMAKIASNAAVAGSGAAASQAPIPIVGPVLAVAAMAAILGSVMAMKGSVKSAAGGYDIPRGVNPLTQLHEEEMVLPKGPAGVIREMAKQGVGERAGDSHYDQSIAMTVNASALDGRGLKSLLLDNHGAVAAALKENLRNHGRVV